MQWVFLICFVGSQVGLCTLNTAKDVAPKTLEEMIRETCLEKTGYKPLDDNTTYFRVLEVRKGKEVTMACSYCGESTEDLPRVWEWRSRTLNSSVQEVLLGLAPRLEDNRLFTYPNHSLVIRNVSTADTGIYYCKSLIEEETTVFQFSVDLVQTVVREVKKDAEVTWDKYNDDHILPTNKLIYQNTQPDLEELLDKVKVRVASEWDPWMPCDGCTGVRRRCAKCRVRPRLNKVKYPDITADNLNENQTLLHRSVVVSCHSQDLARWSPHLYAMTSIVPNFIQEDVCYGDCQPTVRKMHKPKYDLQVRLYLGSSLSFVCPETDLKSKVLWKKDGVTMKPLGARKIKKPKKKTFFKNPLKKKKSNEYQIENAFVDRLNILQLCLVEFKETGLYVCYVNKIPMKAFNVTVVTSEETMRERYYHFWLLSAYTSIISTIIVTMGVTWNYFVRREEFLEFRAETNPPEKEVELL